MTHDPVPLIENQDFLEYVDTLAEPPADPEGRRQAIGQMRRLRSLEAKIAQIQGDAQAEIEAIEAWRDGVVDKLDEQAANLRSAIGNWWTAITDRDPDIGRTADLPHGTVARRTGSLVVDVDNDVTVVAALEEVGVESAIRRREPPAPSIDRTAVKKAVADGILKVAGERLDAPGTYELIEPKTGAVIPGLTLTRNPDQITITPEPPT